jgi:hypothetical protein
MLEGRQHALLRDLVEHQPADLLPVAAAELLGQVPADRLAFAIRVGRDENLIGDLGRVLELLEDLLAARDDLVRRLEPFVDVDTQFALGQVADVPSRPRPCSSCPDIC